MNLIQTLYIHAGKDPFKDSFGWAAPEFHLMGWALSCLQLHKLYGNISLFANSPATHLLIDTLQLPYSRVNLSHDKFDPIHPDLWTLTKIHTHLQQEQPFLHIDGDIFLFELFDPDLLKGEVIAQNVELATDYYYIPSQKELMQHFTFFPPCVKKDLESGTPVYAANTGIVGGNNISFLNEYATVAFEYVQKNADKFQYVNMKRFNVFYEQHLYYVLAKEKGIQVDFLIKDIVEDSGHDYVCLGDFHDVPFNRSYLHLLGNLKKDEFTCMQMAAKLRELYPDYYERIIALFRDKKMRIHTGCFINNVILSTQPIDELNNTYLNRLKFIAEKCSSEIEKELFQNDFKTFYENLLSFLTDRNSVKDLYERDLSAQYWYRDLFADMSVAWHQTVVRCSKTKIIESAFNWAGLFNQTKFMFFGDLQAEKGEFYNLIVPEASDNGFSLYDVKDFEFVILQLLSEPLSIHEIITKLQVYCEDDVLQHHYEEYKNLMLFSIKQLVLKKAIRPA